jgi:hypothetical protein
MAWARIHGIKKQPQNEAVRNCVGVVSELFGSVVLFGFTPNKSDD